MHRIERTYGHTLDSLVEGRLDLDDLAVKYVLLRVASAEQDLQGFAWREPLVIDPAELLVVENQCGHIREMQAILYRCLHEILQEGSWNLAPIERHFDFAEQLTFWHW